MSKEEYESRQKESEAVAKSVYLPLLGVVDTDYSYSSLIMQRLYGSAGAPGSGFPGAGVFFSYLFFPFLPHHLHCPAVPPSSQIYGRQHSERIKKFPFEEDKVVRKPSPSTANRQWRHELDHDAESVFWLLLYWVVLAQPARLGIYWVVLAQPIRTGLLRSLCAEESLEELMHSAYQPLFPLLRNLAAILIVDRHWLDESETQNDPEYVPEAFQHSILQFILDHRDQEFMTREVEPEPRKVEQVGQNPDLLSTASSRTRRGETKIIGNGHPPDPRGNVG